jgi:hypothetical protein
MEKVSLVMHRANTFGSMLVTIRKTIHSLVEPTEYGCNQRFAVIDLCDDAP